MNRNEIIQRIQEQFPALKFKGDNIEQSLFEFSKGDYVNPKRQVEFPIKVEGIYGSGGHAIILKIRDNKNKKYAARVSDSIISLPNIKLQQTLAQYAMAPEILYVGKVPRFEMSYSILEPISATFSQYVSAPNYNVEGLYEALKCLLDKKYLLGFIHGDMNLSNIVILGDSSTLGFIDFDFSFFTRNGELNIVDCIPLFGDYGRIAFKSKNNIKLLSLIKKYYKETFGITIDLSRIVNPIEGGFYYGNLKLNSYFFDRDLESVAKTVRKVFPSLKLPRIVE